MLMIGTKEVYEMRVLDWVLYIHYLLQFQKNKEIFKALINSSRKVNGIALAYARQLGFSNQKTDVKT